MEVFEAEWAKILKSLSGESKVPLMKQLKSTAKELEKIVYTNDSGDVYRRAGFTGRSQGSYYFRDDDKVNGEYSLKGTYKYDGTTISYLGTSCKECGTGSSTTGNIYGIYDMCGGSEEYVMSYYGDANPEFGGRTNLSDELLNSSGFTNVTKPESKYFDLYPKEVFKFDKNLIGHAMAETHEWYASNNTGLSANLPWVVRGGQFTSKNLSIFTSKNSNGGDSYWGSFRIVLVDEGF